MGNGGIKRGLLSQTEAARMLGIDRRTLYEWMHDNCGPQSVLFGKRRYFKRSVIRQWFKARSVAA